MIKKLVRAVLATVHAILRYPYLSLRLMRLPSTLRGYQYSQSWGSQSWRSSAGKRSMPSPATVASSSDSLNPLESYFDTHKDGRGIWKWLHYFDIYHRHFSKFRGREVHVLEIGVYSGGSLEMWREYFGSDCRIYGVDIQEECKAYENDWTKIFIGDQADPGFWKRFREEVPAIDIVIDDGGHSPLQQIVTLEETLPHIRPGGIYFCEDAVGDLNSFHAYVHGLTDNLSSWNLKSHDSKTGTVCTPTKFQSEIRSIHSYPFVTVIEKSDSPLDLRSPKHGVHWQPFLG